VDGAKLMKEGKQEAIKVETKGGVMPQHCS
jgi:hypothetical protein